MRTRWLAPLVVAVVGVGMLSPIAASSAATRGERTMVIFFRHVGTGPRSPLERAAQHTVLSELANEGAKVLQRDGAIGAAAVEVTATEARALAADPSVAAVLPNTLIPGPSVPHVALHASGTSAGSPAHAPCGTHAKPQLNPEGLANIDAVGAATEGYDGAGVTVAAIADGLDPANADFARNPAFASSGSPAGSRVVSVENFTGDRANTITGGAEAFGDAASIAAQGNEVYDLSKLVSRAHPLPANCDIKIQGVAPGSSVLSINIFGFRNFAYAASMVEAINYAVAHHSSVINESFGFNNFPDTSVDIVRQADEAAVAAGSTVVVSSGDAGPDNTIGSPSSDPAVLSVGATTQFRAYAQLSYGGINALTSRGGYVDNNISAFSSGGIAQDGKTVSLVAPGDLGWSLCSKLHRYIECGGQGVQLFGGTSESAPLAAGAAADVIEAYEKTHGGSVPSPQLVMQILTSTARDTFAPAVEQGAGLLDVGAAVRLATSVAGTTLASPPGGLQLDTSQLDLTGLPSSAKSAPIKLTNTSTSATAVQLSTRTLVPAQTNVGSPVINASRLSHDPSFRDSGGYPNVYQRGTFEVPQGTARVQLQAAFGSLTFAGPVEVSLFAPNGDLAAYSIPQGFANYADVEASAPQPGRWTAVFFQPRDGGKKPLDTRVHWRETNLRFTSEGSVSPSSVTLAAGASTTVQLALTLPAAAGDTGFAVVVDAGAQHTTIPVALRTEIALSATGGTFHGVLTGGNGRGGAPGQSNTWSFTVPSGKRDLDVGISMASNPQTPAIEIPDEVGAFLIDPSGQTRAYSVNASLDRHDEFGVSITRFCNLYVTAPQPGAWQLVLMWFQPLDGWATSIPFDGSIEFNAVSISANLPDAASTTIAKSGATYNVVVHNRGVAPMDLSPDARLAGERYFAAGALYGAPLEPEPGANAVYYLPTETQSVFFRQSTSVPATFEAASYAGDPLLGPTTPAPFATEHSSPTYSTLTYTPPGGVTPGVWSFESDGVPPYPSAGSPSGYAILDTQVQASPFDPAVASTVPDLVQLLFTKGDRSVPDGRIVGAGKSTTISIRIDPKAATGAVVTGTLYLNQVWPELVPETLGAIPYEYTVGG
jgi:Subtilase family